MQRLANDSVVGREKRRISPIVGIAHICVIGPVSRCYFNPSTRESHSRETRASFHGVPRRCRIDITVLIHSQAAVFRFPASLRGLYHYVFIEISIEHAVHGTRTVPILGEDQLRRSTENRRRGSRPAADRSVNIVYYCTQRSSSQCQT